MSCPKCDHTMQGLQSDNSQLYTKIFWCPRCGTLKLEVGDRPEHAVPKLVERTRQLAQDLEGLAFCDEITVDDLRASMWRLGVLESVGFDADCKLKTKSSQGPFTNEDSGV